MVVAWTLCQVGSAYAQLMRKGLTEHQSAMHDTHRACMSTSHHARMGDVTSRHYTKANVT